MEEPTKLEEIVHIAGGLVGGAAGLGMLIYTTTRVLHSPVNPDKPDWFLDYQYCFPVDFSFGMPAAIIGCFVGMDAASFAYLTAAKAADYLRTKKGPGTK